MRVGFFGYCLIIGALIGCGAQSAAPAQLAAAPMPTLAPTPTQTLPECATPIPELPPQPELEGFPLPPTTYLMQRSKIEEKHIVFDSATLGTPDDRAIASYSPSTVAR